MSRKYFGRVDILIFFPLLFVIRSLSAGDSPPLKGSERGSPPGQGGAPKAETKQAAHLIEVGSGLIRTLSSWGACYPEKKARRKAVASSIAERQVSGSPAHLMEHAFW